MNGCLVLTGENTSGILFAEDFDAVEKLDQDFSKTDEEVTAEESDVPPEVTYSQAELDAAVKDAVSEAVEESRSEMAVHHQEEIERIKGENKNNNQSVFDSIKENIDSSLNSYAYNLSTTIVTAVVSAFPSWADFQKDLWSPKILDQISSFFSDNFAVSVKIHPDCVSEIKFLLSQNASKKPEIKFVEDENLNRTDFAIEYSDGKIFRHIDEIVSNILTDLSNSMSKIQKEGMTNG